MGQYRDMDMDTGMERIHMEHEDFLLASGLVQYGLLLVQSKECKWHEYSVRYGKTRWLSPLSALYL